MISIKHHEVAELAKTAVGNFSYITIHDGSTFISKKGQKIYWTWRLDARYPSGYDVKHSWTMDQWKELKGWY